MKKLNSQKGFTLIELLIVIAIIAVLAVAFLPSLLGAPAKARDTQRTAQLNKIAGFLLSKSLGGTSLPATSACIDPAGVTPSIGFLINSNLPDFAGNFPKDPKAILPTTSAVPDCNKDVATTNMYGYVKYDGTNAKKYSAAVYSAVEVPGNANIKCGDIGAAKDPTISPGLTLAPADTGCYIVPVQ